MPPTLPPDLLAAYEATVYTVFAGAPVLLRVGAPADLSAFPGARRLAVVTACNPHSVSLSDAANAERNERLRAQAESAGLVHHPALGADPSGAWPPEPSLGVVDPTDAHLDAWMVDFGQNAVVVADADQPVVLRLHPTFR